MTLFLLYISCKDLCGSAFYAKTRTSMFLSRFACSSFRFVSSFRSFSSFSFHFQAQPYRLFSSSPSISDMVESSSSSEPQRAANDVMQYLTEEERKSLKTIHLFSLRAKDRKNMFSIISKAEFFLDAVNKKTIPVCVYVHMTTYDVSIYVSFLWIQVWFFSFVFKGIGFVQLVLFSQSIQRFSRYESKDILSLQAYIYSCTLFIHLTCVHR